MNSTDLECGVDLSRKGRSSLEAEGRPLWKRVLHRVPPQMQKKKKKKKHLYSPSVMSFGPYHQCKPQLRQLEAFKDKVEKVMLKGDDRRLLFRRKILERIDDIRHFYGGLSRDEFNDDVLTDMMLRDACTFLCFMELNAGQDENIELVYTSLGSFLMFEAMGDMVKLENQVPWWLMNSLIRFIYNDYDDDKKGEEFIRSFFSLHVFGNSTDLKQIPWDQNRDEYYPLHFVEARRNAIIAMHKIPDSEEQRSSSLDMPGKRSFRSVSELKAKGIYFKHTSRFVNDINFTYGVFGVLSLPVLGVYRSTEVLFSNVIAFEMSPGPVSADFIWTSYLTFMKSMIQSVEDVKLLQEKGIIMSFTDDNEEIVRLFKEMETHGVGIMPVFDETKMKINKYCENKAKTWIADLINTNFNSPWTVLAFLAATLLLCLTLLQTYYTIKPKN